MHVRLPCRGSRGPRFRGVRAGWVAALALCGMPLAAPARAGSAGGSDASPAPPPVPLENLLRLPAAVPAPEPQPTVGGATRREWLARFHRARADLASARERLDSAQDKLAKLAAGSDSYRPVAPGAQAGASENSPLSYGLREKIRKGREDVAKAKQALEDLRVKANLAGVPADWMSEPAAAQAPRRTRESSSGAPAPEASDALGEPRPSATDR